MLVVPNMSPFHPGGLLNDDSDADDSEPVEPVVPQFASTADDISMSITDAYSVSEKAPPVTLPFTAHAVMVDGDHERISDRRRMACLLVVLSLVIAIVVVPLSLTRGNRGNNENRSVGDAVTTASPSAIALSLPPTPERFSDIREEILTHFESPTLEQDLMNPKSPQYRAALWMAEEDEHPTTASLSYPLNHTGLELLQFRQRYALVTLCYSTGDEKWKDRCNFRTPSLHVCDWRCSWNATDTVLAETYGLQFFLTDYMGVNCGSHLNESNRLLDDLVLSLELVNNNLIGTIPHEMQGLDVLSTLTLNFNWLTGTVPFDALANTMFVRAPLFAEQLGLVDQLLILDEQSTTMLDAALSHTHGVFPSLQSLSLYLNQLTGTIPSTVGLLGELTLLGLSDNQFHGTMPTEIGNLLKLRSLVVGPNQLSGELPSSLGNLTELFDLYLSDNHFSGKLPSTLGQLTGLLFLSVMTNGLTGELPSSLGKLTALRDLSLYGNRFSGELPSILGQMTSLEVIFIPTNRFTGELPSSLGNLTALQMLSLSDNLFSGELPSSLGQLTSLRYLEVSNTGLTGRFPSSLGQLTSLRYLEVSNSGLTGRFPSSLGQLTALRYCNVSMNDFTGGTLPSSLGQLTSLRHLAVAKNGLTGSLPSSLGQLMALTYLDVSMNDFTGTLPSSLGSLAALAHLSVAMNDLTGQLPSSVGQLTALIDLDVSKNRFTGNLMEQALLYKLTALQQLVLDGNAFSGTIPSELGLLTNLTSFSNLVHAGVNQTDPSAEIRQLSGTIPTEVGLMTVLQLLELSGNRLTGSIPTEIANLGETLTTLCLSNNNLSGSLPTELGLLSNLGTLKLFGNALSGSLEHFCSVNPVVGGLDGEFSADCLVDTVTCSCCTACCAENGSDCMDL